MGMQRFGGRLEQAVEVTDGLTGVMEASSHYPTMHPLINISPIPLRPPFGSKPLASFHA